MKVTNIKKLQNAFVGKICTILTKPIAKRDFNDTQFADFFTGLVDYIDEDGVWTTHSITGCKNFYNLLEIIGIIEEQVLHENNPEHAEIIRQSKETSSKYVNIDLMNNLVNQAKGNL